MLGRSGAGSVVVLAILVLILLFGDETTEPGGTGDADVSAPTSAGETVPGVEVLRVVDGDTIEVDLEGSEEDVRYIGIDTPETVKPDSPVECFGPQASERNHELVEDRTVRLEFDRERRDVYGRLLAYVFVGDQFVNAELIEGGFARTLEIEPNTSRAGELNRLEAEAGAAGRGLWESC